MDRKKNASKLRAEKAAKREKDAEAAEQYDDLHGFSDEEIRKMLKTLEKQMKKASEALDFEQAAECRDEIKRLKSVLL